jgi:5-enolpyruvylshikimate-3-phosphate synthase
MIAEMTALIAKVEETAHETVHESEGAQDPPVRAEEIEAGNIGTGERTLVTVLAVVEMVLLTINEGQSETVARIEVVARELMMYVLHTLIVLLYF